MIRGLVELCNLAKDESVLIHPATSVDGVAAIQIARMLEAKVGYFLLISSPQALTSPVDLCDCRYRRAEGASRDRIWNPTVTYFLL
jgi:hypothetical protein